eukprot:7137336-Prymnesium_polylepis.1
MMHTPLYSPTDQGICAGLSRWGIAPSCVSGSIGMAMKKPLKLARHGGLRAARSGRRGVRGDGR